MAKLAVAMSGGVDSSVVAWLLREQGHEVLGLSLRLGSGPDHGWRRGARAARQLGLPHQVVEVSEPFRQQVLQPVVATYAAGRTPNPCALCNARVKLPLLWRQARRLGCQALATGHYVRLGRRDGRRVLCEATYRRKSQAYFLARVEPELLAHLEFPLGEMTKDQVRALARQAGLVAAESPESQDACFLPPGGWDRLMEQFQAVRPGALEDQAGRVLGYHQGLHRFTVGQRRGLGLALGSPMYVLALDGERAAVKVGPAEGLMAQGLWAVAPRWYLPPEGGDDLMVRIRYAHSGVGCRLETAGGRLGVFFERPQRAVAPGQLAVFYRGETVVGSAWIDEAINQA